MRARERAWKERNPGKAAAYEAERRLRRHGLTKADYQRIVERQWNRCALCEVELSELPASKITIDHCHKTGRVRGVLCSACNLFIGHAREDIAALRRAIAYLQRTSP